MQKSLYFAAFITLCTHHGAAFPATGPKLAPRDDRSSSWPPRPDGVDPASFPASEFENFDQIADQFNGGFDSISPVAVHAPVFLYARTLSSNDPCYAEGALNAAGDGPNPGVDKTFGPNPGEDCMDPGPYNGAYSPGNPFPVYVSAAYCGPQEGKRSEGEWRVNYDVYYVHDKTSGIGHKHDWEGITVVFKLDRNKPDSNWYQAEGAIYNRHEHHDWFQWNEIETVYGEEDVREETYGALKKRPKVYVGFYSHSAFRNKCDSSAEDGCELISLAPDVKEYRSNDWYRIVATEDLKIYKVVHGDWGYGAATNTPWTNHNSMCDWELENGVKTTSIAPPQVNHHWRSIENVDVQGKTNRTLADNDVSWIKE